MTKYPNLELSYHQWTVSDYHKLAETGLLSEKRVELIAGEIIDRSPIGKLHAAAVNKLTQLLHQLIGEAGIISVQNPITIHDFSEPEPDLAILRSCLNLTLRFCYGPFSATHRSQNGRLAPLYFHFDASIGKKMTYNKFQKPNPNSFLSLMTPFMPISFPALPMYF